MVIILAAVAILAGVVAVAMGRGGEMARSGPEPAPPPDFSTWSDVAGYRPPPALLGYQAAATEHALALIARTIAERDAEIGWLRERLAQARGDVLTGGDGPADETGQQAADTESAESGAAG